MSDSQQHSPKQMTAQLSPDQHRGGLATARRLYLHYSGVSAAGTCSGLALASGSAPDLSRLPEDLARIVAAFERACDDIDIQARVLASQQEALALALVALRGDPDVLPVGEVVRHIEDILGCRGDSPARRADPRA